VDGAGSLRICFSVADTGPGVPAHVREKIFHEFEQGHVSKVHAGTGLGLALCRDMVSAMGGSIRLECPPDGGSQFSFELTMAIAPTEPEGEARWSAPAALEPMMAPLPAGLRILLADDKPINTKMLALRLSKLLVDPKFTFAVTGEGALELLSTQTFDLAVLDEIYGNDNPDALTGIKLTHAIREAAVQSGQGGELPIIGSTGNEATAHNEAAFAAGQIAVWGKPLPSSKSIERDLQRALCSSSASE